MSTVALSMIVKDEFKEVAQIVSDAINYVDEVNIIVSNKKTAVSLIEATSPFKSVNIKYRKWNNRFDEARNASLAMCTTDFVFWLDADDSFDFSAIEQLVNTAEDEKLDAIFLPYNYMYDDHGNLIARHWRERLVRLGRGYTWRGWVHETLISEENPKTGQIELPVIHNNVYNEEDMSAKLQRNHDILEAGFLETEDPRYLHYLGMSYFSKGEYKTSIKLLNKYLEVGGSIDDLYRALSTISESAWRLENFDEAMEYATKCITLKPEDPQGYWMLAQYESSNENWDKALRWVRMSELCPDPNSLAVWDPTGRIRATFVAARSLFMMNKYIEAFNELKLIRDSEEAKIVWEDFEYEAEKEKFVTMLPALRKFFDSDRAIYHSLSDDLKYDSRLRSLRFSVTDPKAWDKDSIVIFCGQGYEEWGPHTLDKGMGGSEEAVVYLSRELSKLGYNVTVYGEVDSITYDTAYKVNGPSLSSKVGDLYEYYVTYLPWKEIDTRDSFDIFVSWRQPLYIAPIKARVKLVDVHDVLPKNLFKNFPDVTYMVKSQYHSDLLPKDVKRIVIGNGIEKEQFADD